MRVPLCGKTSDLPEAADDHWDSSLRVFVVDLKLPDLRASLTHLSYQLCDRGDKSPSGSGKRHACFLCTIYSMCAYNLKSEDAAFESCTAPCSLDSANFLELFGLSWVLSKSFFGFFIVLFLLDNTL